MVKSKITIFLIVFIAIIPFIFLNFSVSQAAAKIYEIPSIIVIIEASNDGSIIVNEVITVSYVSGTFTFFQRYIPLYGLDYIEVLSISADGANIVSAKVSYSYYMVDVTINYDVIYAPHKVTFNIIYKVYGGILSYGTSQNLIDWNAIGNDWTVSINSVNVLVRLPGNFVESNLLNISPSPIKVYYSDGYTNIAFTYSNLPSYTRYRVVLAFPKIYEPNPDYLYILKNYHGETIISIIVLSTLLTLIVWFIRGRMPKVDVDEGLISLGVLPSNLSPLEVSYLLNERLSFEHAISAILDLAKRGFLNIEYDDKGNIINFKPSDKTECIFVRDAKYGLKPFEIELLRLALNSGNISDFSRNFLIHKSNIEEGVGDELFRMGYFKSNISRRRYNLIKVFTIMTITLIIATFYIYNVIPSNRFLFNIYRAMLPLFAGFGITIIPVGVIMISLFKNYTYEGAKNYWYWKKYLDRLTFINGDDLKEVADKIETTTLFEYSFPYVLLYRPLLFRPWIITWIPYVPKYYHPKWFYTSGGPTVSLDFSAFTNAIVSSIENVLKPS
ncbi:MAG: DUF2207 domain-containing protein [Candidatus Methanomethylicia archaeon]